jgi:hypothetical protein
MYSLPYLLHFLLCGFMLHDEKVVGHLYAIGYEILIVSYLFELLNLFEELFLS